MAAAQHRGEACFDASNTPLYLNESHQFPTSKPAPLLARRQSNLRDSSREGFSEAERRVLQHAADILNVPCSQIIDLQRFQATSTRISNSADPESSEQSWAPEIPHAAWPAVMNTQSFIFGAANINIPACNGTLGQDFLPYNMFQASEGSPIDISTNDSTTSRSTSVPEVHIHNTSGVQEANLDDIFMDNTLSSSLGLALDIHTQEDIFEAPNGRLDNLASNAIFPILEASAWHNQRSPTEADCGLEGRDMMSTHMFSSIADAALGPQLSSIEPTPIVNDGMIDFGLASNMLLQPVREANNRSSREMSTAGILPIDAGHRDALANNSRQHVTQPLIHRPLHPASNSRRVEANHQARAPRNRRRGSQSEIRKARRQGPLKPAERIETGLTRKINACMRCHMQRSRCFPNLADPFGCCLTCLKLSVPTLAKLPCLRYKISDSQLLDKGPHPRFSWTRRWTSMKIIEIDDWKSEEIKTITLTQDVGGAQYSLQVREFTPRDGDSLARAWNSKDGTRSHPCTPYAIADMRAASDVLVKFVDSNIGTFISHYVAKTDKLMTRTYELAHRGSLHAASKQERSLLRAVLRLWVASRMESKQERICSAEVLGMTAQNWDPEATNFRNYLVPPVMQAQIEIITTAMVLLPMKRAVLKDLQSLVEKNKAESWFTIYLATFIILHSCALLTRAEAVRATREGHVGPKSRYHNYQLVEEFHNGARTMLAYYHYCNKGSHPFSMDWTNQSNITFARLDTEQVQYMQEMQAEVDNQSNHFRYIKQDNVFEDDYYFVSQLYELYWAPTHTV